MFVNRKPHQLIMPTFGNFDFVEVYQVVEDVSKQEMKSQLCFLALEEDIPGS
jgi:hypothetical protein